MSAKKLYAIAHFCNDYHSGQSSRGYKLLCLAQRLLKRKGLSPVLLSRSYATLTKEYKTLVNNHSEKV